MGDIVLIGRKIIVDTYGGAAVYDCGGCLCIFFFSSRRRHTRLQGDWSSDVCSSDLSNKPGNWDSTRGRRQRSIGWKSTTEFLTRSKQRELLIAVASAVSADNGSRRDQIGRASCRERV